MVNLWLILAEASEQSSITLLILAEASESNSITLLILGGNNLCHPCNLWFSS